jgi:hypothetical protein
LKAVDVQALKSDPFLEGEVFGVEVPELGGKPEFTLFSRKTGAKCQ